MEVSTLSLGEYMIPPGGKTNHEIVRIREICRDIEMISAQLYGYYAEVFCDDADLARLWSKTAMEEEEHAKQFVMAINLRNQWRVEAVTVDSIKAESMLDFITSIYDVAKTHEPTKVDALRSAILLESAFAEFHMNAIALFAEEGHRKFFTYLRDADRRHVAALEDFHRNQSASEDWVLRNA